MMTTTKQADSWEQWDRDCPDPEDRELWRLYDAIKQRTEDEIYFDRIYGQTVESLSRDLDLPENKIESLIEQLIEQGFIDEHPGRDRFGVGASK